MWRRWAQSSQGSVAVETALILPLMLLLTVGGLSVLWWQHNRTMMHLLVAEAAREQAADTQTAGLLRTGYRLIAGPKDSLRVPGLKLLAVQVPGDPPYVLAGACATPGGRVPMPPALGPGPAAPPARRDGPGWLRWAWTTRQPLEEVVATVHAVETELEAGLDLVIEWGERLTFYRQMTEQLASGVERRRRVAVEYLLGGAIEQVADLPCAKAADGGTVLTAKVVMRGEKTYGQR